MKMASKGKQRPAPQIEEQSDTKKLKLSTDGDEMAQKVQLNPADCNLDFDIEDNGLQGHALHDKGFAYCWSGARASVGIRGGKYCFSCKVTATQPVEMEDTPPDQQNLCRVGVSRGDDNVGSLGETGQSFGYGGTGKFSTGGKFLDYGSKFSVGDTILCAVNLESHPLAEISFSKNGSQLGVAKRFDSGPKGIGVTDTPLKKLHWESAIFPHVLLKNVVVQMQFSIEDGLVPLEGYKPWNASLKDVNGVIGPQFGSVKECEVLMMVGLPASGKTTWAENWVKSHPEKRYMLLGTNLALDQMKVHGLLRKGNYGERFDRLMDRATNIFNTLLARAAKIPRNFILDQTNVYKSARKRKLRPFVDYRKIAVVIFPPPQELKIRAKKRFKEMGKEVPPEAVNEMLANYVLPTSKDMRGSDEFFDEVWFPELKREEAHVILETDKSELKASSMTKSRDASPYSRAGSVASVTGPRSVHTGVSPAPGGNWRGTPVYSSDHDIHGPPKIGDVQSMPDRVHSTPNTFQGTLDSFRGRPEMFRGAPATFRGTPEMFRGTPDTMHSTPGFHGMLDRVQGTPEMMQGHRAEFGDSRGSFSVPADPTLGRYGREVGDQRFPRVDQPFTDHRDFQDQPYTNQRGFIDQSYSAQSGYRDQPSLDQRGYKEQHYPGQGGPYSVNTDPQFGRPQSYGIPDPGRIQTQPYAPPRQNFMPPHPGWGHEPY